mgnify:CR=1 FL=1|jgi:hypothetical protein
MLCQAGRLVGEGVRWSADRQKAWRLRDGQLKEALSLDDARALGVRVSDVSTPPTAQQEQEQQHAAGEQLLREGAAFSEASAEL